MTIDYFKQTVPPRESRLKPCIAYGGSGCAMAGGNSRPKACLETADRSFSQGSICLLLPALGTLTSLPNTAVLLHGAIGCGSSVHAATAIMRAGGNLRWGKIEDALWMSTALNELEIITGGERKLEEAIVEIDRRYSPASIIVVACCVPGITGDDIEGVLAGVQTRVASRLLPVHCEGFKTRIWATAYDAYYHAMGRHLFDVPEGAPPVDPSRARRTVNLLNVSSMSRADELELERLLKALGLDVNIFPVFSKPLEMYKVTQAGLSISVCPTHDDYLLTHLKEKYGIPYVLRDMPIGISNTGLWLRDVAGHLGLEREADTLIAREEAALTEALKGFIPAFQGKRVFLSSGEYRTLATAHLLQELGFKIAAVRPFHYDEFAEHESAKLLEQAARTGGEADFTLNVANCQPFEEANLIRKLKPDLFLGHLNCNSTAAKLGIPTHTIYHTGLNYLGYKGAFELARRLHRQLRNPAFNRRLSEHVKLPYRDEWYEADPFQYINEPARLKPLGASRIRKIEAIDD